MNASRVTISKSAFGSQFGLGILSLSLALLATSASAQSVQPTMRALSGGGQDAAYGSTFAKPLTVWVTDPATQQSLSGIRVEFAAAPGIGLSDTFAVTNEKGLASVTATGLTATTSSASAEIPTFPSTKVTFDGLLVKKAILTVVPIDMQANAGGEIPAITDYTIQGFVHGDTEATSNISGTPVLSTTATSSSPHANYAIKGGVGTLESPNYTFVAGFGTMAILGNGKEGSANSELAVQTPEGGDGSEVRPAIEDGSSATAAAQPAFLAGLRGTSGVFVRAAIWQSSTATTSKLQNANTHSAAMPKLITDRNKSSDAPVRAVALPALAKTGANAAMAQSINTQVVMMPVAAASQPSYNGSAIRKAFNPPGMK
jgi:MBG domain (YGX type)